MRFEWDEEKNRTNLLKHGLSFETAALVFDDPHSLTRRDPFFADEERWITLGVLDPIVVVFVVHTWFEGEDEEIIRIISARSATPRERKLYEEAQRKTETRNRQLRRKERPRH
jgi:uncharacterized protein